MPPSNKINARPPAARPAQRDDLQRLRVEYTQALARGDGEATQGVIAKLLAHRCALNDIYAEVITPALITIGDLWCKKDIGVAEEHLASQLVVSHLDRLSSLYAWRDRLLFFRVLVGCIEGERHWLGARMFADLCLSHGWSAEFLGPDVPDAALLEIVRKREPQVVALSVTMTSGVEHLRRVARSIAVLPKPPKIILGGKAMTGAAPQSFGTACVIARDAANGVEIALKFLRANRPKAVLKEYLTALGRRVREFRLKKAWTQEQLAAGARVTRVCIVAVEGGKQNVSMDIVLRLANALGVSPQELITDIGAPQQLLEKNP